MASDAEYRSDRRVDPVRRLSAVTLAEVQERMEDERLRRYEALREGLADERRRNEPPRRSFAELLER